MEEDETSQRRREKISKIGTNVAVGSYLAIGLAALGFLYGSVFFATIESKRIDRKNNLANKVARAYYEPVGNGGALAAWNGRVSPERRKMYQRMLDAYDEAMGEKVDTPDRLSYAVYAGRTMRH